MVIGSNKRSREPEGV